VTRREVAPADVREVSVERPYRTVAGPGSRVAQTITIERSVGCCRYGRRTSVTPALGVSVVGAVPAVLKLYTGPSAVTFAIVFDTIFQ
jgi:hypothetical protein